MVTYNHHPLYTFVKDTGTDAGEEIAAFGAEWYALSPAGTKVKNNQVKSSSEDSSDPSGRRLRRRLRVLALADREYRLCAYFLT